MVDVSIQEGSRILNEYLNRHKMGIREFARAKGVSKTSVAKLANGEEIGYSTLIKIYKALGYKIKATK